MLVVEPALTRVSEILGPTCNIAPGSDKCVGATVCTRVSRAE